MRMLLAGFACLSLVACGEKSESKADTAPPAAASPAGGCAADGLSAMESYAKLVEDLQEAKDAGKLTLDQLLALRDKANKAVEPLVAKKDWAGYCAAIDAIRKEAGL